MQIDHPIPARRPDLVIIEKENSPSRGFCVPVNHSEKIKESEKIDKYLVLARKLKNL